MHFIPVMKKLQEAAHKYGVEMLAPEMGIEAPTLYAILNPYSSGKKLWLERALIIMSRSGDFSALAEFLDQHGLRIVRKNPVPDGLDLNHECLQAYEASGDFLKSASNGEHYTALVPKLEKAIKEHDDVLARCRKRDEERVRQ